MRAKNNTGSTKVWVGQSIEPGAYYTLNANDVFNWSINDTVLTDIASSSLVINDGISDLSVATGLKLLTGKIVEVEKLAEGQPFAEPTYRTKRDKTPSLVTIAPGATEVIDYQITEEKYIHGGILLHKNSELGDIITAEVYDKDSVIPAPYRAALCEAWPSVAKYIIGMWVPEGTGRIENNTYPLNAKITAGLYLRMTYTATNTGSNRTIGVNYHLTKKL